MNLGCVLANSPGYSYLFYINTNVNKVHNGIQEDTSGTQLSCSGHKWLSDMISILDCQRWNLSTEMKSNN